MPGGRRGPSSNIQRALGWIEEQRERPRIQEAYCSECGALLDFDVADPMMLGRSMERCTNRDCVGRVPHPVIRQLL
jgi:hypothetical protein